jgi:hypothetical protein
MDRSQWFVVWGSSRGRALRTLAEDLGDVDLSTVQRVDGTGYFLFRPQADGVGGLLPSEGEVLVMHDQKADAWIASSVADEAPSGRTVPVIAG